MSRIILSLTFLTFLSPRAAKSPQGRGRRIRIANPWPPDKWPSAVTNLPHISLASQASHSWPARLTTAINPTEKQKSKKLQTSLPVLEAQLLPTSFCSPQNSLNRTESESPCSVYRGPVCPGRRAHSNGASSNCIDSLAPLTGSSVCDLLAPQGRPPRPAHYECHHSQTRRRQ